MDSPKARLCLGIDWGVGEGAITDVFIGDGVELTLHSQYKVTKDERGEFVYNLVVRHKPDQLSILVQGKSIPLSEKTLGGILKGTVTKEDLKI